MDELREVCPDLDKYIDIIAKNVHYNVVVRLSNMDIEELSAANSISTCMDKMSDWRKIIYSIEDISFYLIDIVARHIFKRWKMGDITLDELLSIRKQKILILERSIVIAAILIADEENNNDEETVKKLAALVDKYGGYYVATKEISLNASKFVLEAFRRLKIRCTIDIGEFVSDGIESIKNTGRMKEWISCFSNDDLVAYIERRDDNEIITPFLSSLLIERVGLETLIEICKEPTNNEYSNVAYSVLDVTLHLNV